MDCIRVHARGFFRFRGRNMRKTIEVGLLYARSGTYSLISEVCRRGALQAIADVNEDPDSPVTLVPVERDPAGNIDNYAPMCADILRQTSARHIFGPTTSWSRKEVIPVLEKVGATLWYVVPYEGFEASDHVVYTHGCPNQHLLPLLHWAMPRYGRRAYLTGSNYIWGWELNRVARDVVTEAGGKVLGERHLALGSTDIGRMIDEIAATGPDFVLNNLVGASSYAFLRAFADLGARDPRFAPARCPVLSCNLTECELSELGAASEGLISVGPHFAGSTAWQNGAAAGFASSFEASAYAAMRRLAILLAAVPDAETLPLDQLLARTSHLHHGIDLETHHAALPVLIAQVEQARFVVREALGQVLADPYLSRTDRRIDVPRPRLSVVK